MEQEIFETNQKVLSERIKTVIEEGNKLQSGSEAKLNNAKEIELLMKAYCQNDESCEKAYIEERKIDLEEKKLKAQTDWKHLAIEVGKVAVPFVIAMCQIALYRESRNMDYEFSESGKIHGMTGAGRGMSVPNIFRWK